MRISSSRVAIIMALVLTTLTVPAVAWARTSPKTTVDTPVEAAQVHGRLDVGGTASHRVGVAGVRLVVRNIDDNTYFNGDRWQREFTRIDIPVHDTGATRTRWSYSVPTDKLTPASYRARAFAYSVEGNGDGFGGDWNEFTYLGRFDPAIYDTEVLAPANGQTVPAGAISISGIARSTEGVASVRVVVRNRETNRYWNADLDRWQASFVTAQAALDRTGDRTEARFVVNVPAEQVEPGTYFSRAWVRTDAGNGDPIGRGRTTFTVEPATVSPPTTIAPGTTVAPPTTAETTTTTARKASSTTATTAPEPSSTTYPPTTLPPSTTTAPPTTAPPTTAPPTTVAPTSTSRPATTVGSSGRRPYAHGDVDWELITSDDFNGSSLDDDLWEYGWWGASDGNKYDRPVSNNETACYHTDQVTVSGGALSLSMRPTTAAEDAAGVCQKKDGSPASFVSGYATTRQRLTIRPGTYIETRMFMPGEGNVLYNWPAFWTTDMDRFLGSRWPHSGEFDVAEILKGQPCGNYHYATASGGAHQQTGKRCSTVSANRWVVFGMKWNHDGTVEFYHDGQRVQDRGDGGDWTIDTRALAGAFAIDYGHNIALQHGMNHPSHPGYKEPTAGNPLIVKFDYVDVYRL